MDGEVPAEPDRVTQAGPFSGTLPESDRRSPGGPRWFPIAVVAAIVLAGALIAAAIFFRDTGGSSAPTASAPSDQPSDGRTKTCAAWARAKSDFKAIPRLPPGWTYETPGIDQLIAGRTAMVEKVLEVFRSQIAPTPVDVAAAANLFVEKQQAEVTDLPARTFDSADVYAIDGAYRALDRACGAGG